MCFSKMKILLNYVPNIAVPTFETSHNSETQLDQPSMKRIILV